MSDNTTEKIDDASILGHQPCTLGEDTGMARDAQSPWQSGGCQELVVRISQMQDALSLPTVLGKQNQKCKPKFHLRLELANQWLNMLRVVLHVILQWGIRYNMFSVAVYRDESTNTGDIQEGLSEKRVAYVLTCLLPI